MCLSRGLVVRLQIRKGAALSARGVASVRCRWVNQGRPDFRRVAESPFESPAIGCVAVAVEEAGILCSPANLPKRSIHPPVLPLAVMAGPRDYLIHLLTEAAEIEHNLLCSYLYAAFSLKIGCGEGLSEAERELVRGWHKSIVGVAIEEMGHLALVNNLLVAVGGAPHFDRPNLPVPVGYHPSGFVIRLAPFTRDTLEHFIFLERPAQAKVQDPSDKYRHEGPARYQTAGHLTPSTPDYETIGAFYDAIREALVAFGTACGEDAFLAASLPRQLSPEDAQMPGLRLIRGMDDALQALEAIVEQGEGSSSEKEDCHFMRFVAIRREWDEALEVNAGFQPSHKAAQDPVMRQPAEGLERVWITEPAAARLLDLGNALYGVTLTLLEHAYARGMRQRRQFVDGAMGLMHALAGIGSALARMPARTNGNGVNAGLTFAMPRNLHSLPQGRACQLLCERLTNLYESAADLDAHAASEILKVQGFYREEPSRDDDKDGSALAAQ